MNNLKDNLLKLDDGLLEEIIMVGAIALNDVDKIKEVAQETSKPEARVQVLTTILASVSFGQNKIFTNEEFENELNTHTKMLDELGIETN